MWMPQLCQCVAVFIATGIMMNTCTPVLLLTVVDVSHVSEFSGLDMCNSNVGLFVYIAC